MRISDWSSDVCSSDLVAVENAERAAVRQHHHRQGLLRGAQGRGQVSVQSGAVTGVKGNGPGGRHVVRVEPVAAAEQVCGLPRFRVEHVEVTRISIAGNFYQRQRAVISPRGAEDLDRKSVV